MIPSNGPFSFGLEKDPQSFVVIPEEDSVMLGTDFKGDKIYEKLATSDYSYFTNAEDTEDEFENSAKLSTKRFEEEYLKPIESILDTVKKGAEREAWIYKTDEEKFKEKLGPLADTLDKNEIVDGYEAIIIEDKNALRAEVLYFLQRTIQNKGQSVRYAFGDTNVHHILTAELFYNPTEPMRSIQIIFTSFYFNLEYIIGLSSATELLVHLYNIVNEITEHHDEFVNTLRNTSGQPSKIEFEDLKAILLKVAMGEKLKPVLGGLKKLCSCKIEDKESFCLEDGEQGGAIQDCAGESNPVFMKVKTFNDAASGDGFELEIKENKLDIEKNQREHTMEDIVAQKNSRGFITNYKFFQNNTYDEFPVVESFLTKALYHFLTGKFIK